MSWDRIRTQEWLLDGRRITIATAQIRDVQEFGETGLDRFTELEMRTFRDLKVDKRRWEWAAGRAAAKSAVAKVYGVTPADVEIEPNWTRKPFAKVDGVFIDRCISITHSGELALAAISDSNEPRIGIDIEQIENRPEGFKEEAFAPVERKELDNADEFVLEMWSRKESALKALGIGFGLPLHDIMIGPDGGAKLSAAGVNQLMLPPETTLMTHRLHLDTQFDKDYVLTICIMETQGSLEELLVETESIIESSIEIESQREA